MSTTTSADRPTAPNALTVPVSEFCEMIGVKRSMAFGLIRLGEVDVVRIGRKKTLVTTESIERLLERNLTKGLF